MKKLLFLFLLISTATFSQTYIVDKCKTNISYYSLNNWSNLKEKTRIDINNSEILVVSYNKKMKVKYKSSYTKKDDDIPTTIYERCIDSLERELTVIETIDIETKQKEFRFVYNDYYELEICYLIK